MKHAWLGLTRENFSTRLMLGFVLLVLATILSAGLPAYWLTSRQLETQSWNRTRGAAMTTLSLIDAAQVQLEDSLLLFVERPTLQQLLAEERLVELEQYITNFTRRSGIDLLLVCDESGLPVAGDRTLDRCAPQATTQLTRMGTRPILLASRAIGEEAASEDAASAVAGLWLDDAF